MQINYILLGQRIRAFRTKKGITQMELAERIDRSAAFMWKRHTSLAVSTLW